MIPRKPIRSRRRKPGPGRLKGEALEALRRACFERDGYQCQQVLREEPMPGFEADLVSVFRCWKRVTWESGHMAHIVSRGRGGKDELSNVKNEMCASAISGSNTPTGPAVGNPCHRPCCKNGKTLRIISVRSRDMMGSSREQRELMENRRKRDETRPHQSE